MPESNTQDSNLLNFAGEIEINRRHVGAATDIEIRQLVSRILLDHKFETGELSVAIVDDMKMHELNLAYLRHDYTTDVLSFLLDLDPECKSLSGEVIVNAQMAARKSQEYGHTEREELLLYIVHGTLHLVGYNDDNDTRKSEMMRLETRYLKSLGIPELAERTSAPMRNAP
ncbi:MAG TPA: rRNA maturation RNase YbeY [Pirellulaceae bacterium]|nr:rRNA maturation RNase YbeY [Pirellulaceae bacterium]HMO91389.1 rRNA maturation RNase YbeY [Pirellulaceae bacterium]HMP69614.1 rRNA maturation RNase YbeY [Pirellulaceae bacterium]